jgi:asparagine synthase (glutamine-hydrolysing)
MCGIVGFQGRFDAELLPRMTDAVAHRGPDARGGVVTRLHDTVTGLGHRRLAIIDLSSAGLQPMRVRRDAGGGMQDGLTLIFNGEIYNYRELRAELTEAGHVFESATDSEVLLHLYEQAGLDMVGRLNGIFAFAIHDTRPFGRPPGVERDSLFVARDQLGVKPLYYAETPSGFLCGSEMKALLEDDSIPRDIDVAALHETLAYLWTPAPRTILRGVRKLGPGQAMIVNAGRIRKVWTYYEQPYDGGPSTMSERALRDELTARLRTAVRRQLVADVPVGAFLSGGLDSSAVVAMMRREWPDRPITCFTVRLAGNGSTGGGEDLAYAKQVAAHLGVSLEEVEVHPSSILRIEEVVRLLDEPQADPAPINALLIAERARALGIPVLLSGAGGDDLFGGYRRHAALNFEKRWRWLPQKTRTMLQSAARRAANGERRGQAVEPLRRLTKMFTHAGEEADRRLVAYFQWSTDEVRRGLYSPWLARETAQLDVAAPLLASLSRIPAERDPLQRMLFLEARHFLADHNLNYTDRAGMAVGVEVRVPLLDIDLVNFAARVPASMKQKGRRGKVLFKDAMRSHLPAGVIDRPKTGFGAPLRRWLRHELREMVGDILAPDAVRRRGFFDPDAVSRLIAMDRQGRIDGSYLIFALLSFELWMRAFLDKPSAARHAS